MAEDTAEEQILDENDGATEDAVEDEDQDAEDEKEEVVPVRKSVINAQRRIIEKQSKQLQKTSKSDERSDEELTSQAQKLIDLAVDERLRPLQQEMETTLLLRDYLADNPEHKKFEGQAKKYLAAHPTLTVEDAFKIVTFGKDGEDKSKAEEKVVRNRMGGSTKRPEETKVASTQKDFDDVYKKIKRGETKDALRALGIEK